MDGAFDKLEELIYVESHLSQTSSKFYGEITQQMLKNSSFPGSTNGTGLFQTKLKRILFFLKFTQLGLTLFFAGVRNLCVFS